VDRIPIDGLAPGDVVSIGGRVDIARLDNPFDLVAWADWCEDVADDPFAPCAIGELDESNNSLGLQFEAPDPRAPRQP
jgi:hypothetical protein